MDDYFKHKWSLQAIMYITIHVSLWETSSLFCDLNILPAPSHVIRPVSWVCSVISATLSADTAGRPVCVAIGDPVGGTTQTCTGKSLDNRHEVYHGGILQTPHQALYAPSMQTWTESVHTPPSVPQTRRPSSSPTVWSPCSCRHRAHPVLFPWSRRQVSHVCAAWSSPNIKLEYHVGLGHSQPMFSHGLCNWYSQPTARFLHNSYSSRCRLTHRFFLISYIGWRAARPMYSTS